MSLSLRSLSSLIVLAAAVGYSSPALATDGTLAFTKIDAAIDAANITCGFGGFDNGTSTALYRLVLSGKTQAQLDGITAAISGVGVSVQWKHYIDIMGDVDAYVDTSVSVSINGTTPPSGSVNFRNDTVGTVTWNPHPYYPMYPTDPSLQNGDIIEVNIDSMQSVLCLSTGPFHQGVAKGIPVWGGVELNYTY